jgi:hypothetical protein
MWFFLCVLLDKWSEADISCPQFYILSLDNLFNNIILHFINNIKFKQPLMSCPILFLSQMLRSLWQFFLLDIRGVNPAQCMNYFWVMYIKSPLPHLVTWCNESYHSHETILQAMSILHCHSSGSHMTSKSLRHCTLTHIRIENKQHCNT